MNERNDYTVGSTAGIRRIERLAIVNRGEAAVRCLRTAKALREQEGGGLEVIALVTPPDRDAPFARQADRERPFSSLRTCSRKSKKSAIASRS